MAQFIRCDKCGCEIDDNKGPYMSMGKSYYRTFEEYILVVTIHPWAKILPNIDGEAVTTASVPDETVIPHKDYCKKCFSEIMGAGE